jgi:hypothetical protein
MTAFGILLIASLLTAGVVAAAADNGATSPSKDDEPPMEVVLVTGEQPGPALWKVLSGDHVLWILGEVLPVPRKMKWRSKRFERVLAIAIGGEQRVNDYVNKKTETWLNEAERAMRENRSSIAVVAMSELLATDGYVAGLRARGFAVVEPD